jgi:hypothetical protein
MAAFPNFIIIGAMKCGTTVMWHNMNNHPDITMGKNWEDPKKASTEIHFWDNGKPYRTWGKGIDWYKCLFKGTFNGEKCANYIESQKAMKKIGQYVPDVKIIICVRNPIERAFSEFTMMEHTRPKIYQLGFGRLAQREHGDLVEKGRYMKMIKNNVLPFIKKENIYISVQEWMRKDTNGELNKIYKFLGLQELDLEVKHVKADQKDVQMNEYKEWSSKKNKGIRRTDRRMLAKYYVSDNGMFFNFFGQKIGEWDEKVFSIKRR